MVLISGSTSIATTSAAGLNLNADAYVSQCSGNVSRSGLVYTWSASVDGVQDLSLVSTSKQYYSYKLDPYVLTVNTLYTISLTVLDSVTLELSTNSVLVSVEPTDIVAVIKGGNTQAVQLGSSITLDASGSYNNDISGTSK